MKLSLVVHSIFIALLVAALLPATLWLSPPSAQAGVTAQDAATIRALLDEIHVALVKRTGAPSDESFQPLDPIRTMPFYSQFADITDVHWRKVGCGIAGIAMLIDYYGAAADPDTLLARGIARGAYLSDAGWTHAGLIGLARDYGLTGASIGLADQPMASAFAALKSAVAEGPVMASVHYTFVPTNPIPHLVVVTGIKDGRVYYNDPADQAGAGSISAEQFQSAWKKRYIKIRPTVGDFARAS